MRKYIFIFKSELMSNLQYIFNLLFGFVGYFIMMFIFLNLWKYIYSDPNELINGYSMNQMIWYISITEILWGIVGGRKFCTKISNDVRGGNISYNINKPYNYIGYCLANHLGLCAVRSVMYFVLGIGLGYLFLGSFPNLNLFSIIAILITCILATIVSTLLIIFIGLFSFIIEDSTPFYWIYSKFILLFGTLFPIEYFPKIVQPILKYSPIYAINYGPAKLFVDFYLNGFILVLIAQIIYIIISFGLCSLVYKKGVKKLNVNGG